MTLRYDRTSLSRGTGLGLILLCVGPVAARASVACPAPSTQNYAGQVHHYIADLKPSFPEHNSYSAATALTEANYRAVLEGLRRNVGVDGIRLPIVPSYGDAAEYPPLYREVIAAARNLGLLIYASPMSVGMRAFAGWSDDRYADWLAAYAEAFGPDVLSPFNEAGIGDARIASIVSGLRARLKSATLLAGPDRQHVGKTVDDVARDPALASLFDIVDSHNADRDGSATAANWSRLVGAVAGSRPVWSSENPAGWGHGQVSGLPGLDQAVAGGVQGLVIWMAKPSLVDDAGRPTPKACEILAHLMGG